MQISKNVFEFVILDLGYVINIMSINNKHPFFFKYREKVSYFEWGFQNQNEITVKKKYLR